MMKSIDNLVGAISANEENPNKKSPFYLFSFLIAFDSFSLINCIIREDVFQK